MQINGHIEAGVATKTGKLAKWIKVQKQLERTGKLRQDRKVMLDQLGICWEKNGPGHTARQPKRARGREDAGVLSADEEIEDDGGLEALAQKGGVLFSSPRAVRVGSQGRGRGGVVAGKRPKITISGPVRGDAFDVMPGEKMQEPGDLTESEGEDCQEDMC